MAYRVTIKSTRAIHSMQRGCLSVENTNGSLLEASLIKSQSLPQLAASIGCVERPATTVAQCSSKGVHTQAHFGPVNLRNRYESSLRKASQRKKNDDHQLRAPSETDDDSSRQWIEANQRLVIPL